MSLEAQIYLELEAKTDLNFEEIIEQTEAFFDDIGREKGKGYNHFADGNMRLKGLLMKTVTLRLLQMT